MLSKDFSIISIICDFVKPSSARSVIKPSSIAFSKAINCGLPDVQMSPPTFANPFVYFSESGTNANAFTDFDNTQYICYGTKNFEDNLKFLLSYVNEPYYTDENVEKEKGIIEEEIKMYNDMPEHICIVRSCPRF